jgi:hypothetical protein
MLTLRQSRSLLTKGVYEAARKCLAAYGGYSLNTKGEHSIQGGSSMVDVVVTVGRSMIVLCEAKSPSVMKKLGELLPPRGIELKWTRDQSLVQKILSKVSMVFFADYDAGFNKYMQSALYLGQRKMEWLFLTCHNYWLVCRLVKDARHPFLAYSSMMSIEDSSEPFRAFLGAILSVVKGVTVQPSPFNLDVELDGVTEEVEVEDPDIVPGGDIDDSSGTYRGRSSTETETEPRMTRARKRALEITPFLGRSSTGTETEPRMTRGRERALEATRSGLMVRPTPLLMLVLDQLIFAQITSSSPSSPASFQVWLHLHTFPGNTFALPQCSRSGTPRLWLTQFLGFGSTGNVWKCHFDDSDDSFAIKIVEVLCSSDTDSHQWFRDEFNIYLTLEEAVESGKRHNRIAPRCYGAFSGDGIDVLIFESCGGNLRAWNELKDSSER